MDETERVAVHSLYKEIKNLIEKKNPHDRNALAQIEEIKGKSKVIFSKTNFMIFFRVIHNFLKISLWN